MKTYWFIINSQAVGVRYWSGYRKRLVSPICSFLLYFSSSVCVLDFFINFNFINACENELIYLNIWWLLKIGLRKWFFWCQGIFPWILIPKMDLKMNFRMIMKNHAADSKIESPLKIDLRADQKSNPTAWELNWHCQLDWKIAQNGIFCTQIL